MVRLDSFLDRFLNDSSNTIIGLFMMVRFFWYDDYSGKFYPVSYDGRYRYYGIHQANYYYAFDVGCPRLSYSKLVVQSMDFSRVPLYVLPKPGFEDLFYKEFPKQLYNAFER